MYSEGGPDWTAFGGNGNGQYYFNLTVSGLTYQGLPVPDSTFRVCYYVYGRDASDKARITLADYINVSRGFIGDVENPKRRAKYNLHLINEIAKVLKCSPRDFLPPEPLE